MCRVCAWLSLTESDLYRVIYVIFIQIAAITGQFAAICIVDRK